MAAALVAPSSRGSVSIASADAADPPIVDPGFLTDLADRELAIAAFKRLRALFAAPAMRDVLVGDEAFPGPQVQADEEILATARKSFNNVFHAAGTCAMGKFDDPNTVVDTRGRVIGVERLCVVDASAFPFLPPGHPMATVYALAEKIADDIRSGR